MDNERRQADALTLQMVESLAELKTDIRYIRAAQDTMNKDIKELQDTLQNKYVTKDDFNKHLENHTTSKSSHTTIALSLIASGIALIALISKFI
jgi:hypothetical protein